MTIIYNNGLDLMATWTTDAYGFALVTGSYTPDKDHIYLYEATVGNEVTTIDVNYVRSIPTNPTRNVDDFLDRIAYDCDDLLFGDPDPGQGVEFMILYKGAGDFAELIACVDLVRTTDGDPFIVILNAAGLLVTDQGA